MNLARIRAIADYQFGKGVGTILFPIDVEIIYSKNTGRIRHIYLNDTLQATLRPTDSLFTLTINGASRLIQTIPEHSYAVIVNDDVSEFVSKGKNVFAKHVVDAGEGIRPGDEVIILTGARSVVGVGKALLTRNEMRAFKKGVAVKTRRGSEVDV